MVGYWTRHRLLFTLILCIVVALLGSLLFAFPYVEQKATYYNESSLYKNTGIDFIVPEPSYEQVTSLPGTNGIASVFPFYETIVSVHCKEKNHDAALMIANHDQELESTMFNSKRIIEKSNSSVSNPVLVDWTFCKAIGARMGDVISFDLGNGEMEYQISAIFEANPINAEGTILLQASDEVMESIQAGSSSNGYSAMFVSASEYDTCNKYLSDEYKPLGRLRDRNVFDSDERYQIHYNAIMDSNYANEITDFRAAEGDTSRSPNSMMIWVGAILSAIILLAFNFIMGNRGCESVYFKNHCIPKGQNIKPYYMVSFLAETIGCILIYIVVLNIKISSADFFIHKTVSDFLIWINPISIVIAEVISYFINCSKIQESRNTNAYMPQKEVEPVSQEQNSEPCDYVNQENENSSSVDCSKIQESKDTNANMSQKEVKPVGQEQYSESSGSVYQENHDTKIN